MTQVKDGKGKLLSIGHLYEFSDGGKDWVTSKLHSVDPLKPNPYRRGPRGTIGYKQIRELRGTVGKIDYVPVELIDGEVYSFTEKAWDNRARLVGFYKKSMDAFYVNTHPSSAYIKDLCEVTDIVLLKPVP